MARNGSGTYNRIHNWVQDADADIPITASRMDAEDDSIATALTNSIAKDGQTTPTANLPMGGFKHTNAADGSARTDYATLGQHQDSAGQYAVATGSSNAYAITLSPAITAYATGQVFRFQANHANTGAATLNVSAVGAKDIKMADGTAPTAGDIPDDSYNTVLYDGTNFILLTVPQYAIGTWTPTGNGVTFSAASGRYIKIGKKVTLYFSVTWSSNADGALAKIAGFPFANNGTYPGAGAIGRTSEATAMVLAVEGAGEEATLRAFGDTAGTGMTNAELSTDIVLGVIEYSIA